MAVLLSLVASPAGAQDAEARVEATGALKAIHDAYLADFSAAWSAIREENAEAADQLLAFCISPETDGVFGSDDLSDAQKLAALEPQARQFVERLGDGAAVAGRVNLCRAAAAAEGYLWAGALFALIEYGLSERAGGDLVAAYYASEVLPASDPVLALKYLRDTRAVHEKTDPEVTLAALGFYNIVALQAELSGYLSLYGLDEGFAIDLEDLEADAREELDGRDGEDAVRSVACGAGDASRQFEDESPDDFRSSVAADADALAVDLAEEPEKTELVRHCLAWLVDNGHLRRALVYAVALAETAEATEQETQEQQEASAPPDTLSADRTAGILFGSGALGFRDYTAALRHLDAYHPAAGDAAQDVRHRVRLISNIDEGAMAPMISRSASESAIESFAESRARLDMAFDNLQAQLARSVEERLSAEQDQTDDAPPCEKSEEEAAGDPASVDPLDRLLSVALEVLTILGELDHHVRCFDLAFAEGDYWSAWMHARVAAEFHGSSRSFLAAGTIAGSGVLDLRDYAAARAYLRRYAGAFRSPPEGITQMVDFVTAMEARGYPLLDYDQAD